MDLSADLFFVKKLPMLIALTRNVRLVMGVPLVDRKVSTISDKVNKIIHFQLMVPIHQFIQLILF